jgi:hypothetical protein
VGRLIGKRNILLEEKIIPIILEEMNKWVIPNALLIFGTDVFQIVLLHDEIIVVRSTDNGP